MVSGMAMTSSRTVGIHVRHPPIWSMRKPVAKSTTITAISLTNSQRYGKTVGLGTAGMPGMSAKLANPNSMRTEDDEAAAPKSTRGMR
jgi:hypothetical protein